MNDRTILNKIWSRYITVDETWIHHYQPKIKQQSKEWVVADGRAPKEAKTVSSAGKVMDMVLWGRL